MSALEAGFVVVVRTDPPTYVMDPPTRDLAIGRLWRRTGNPVRAGLFTRERADEVAAMYRAEHPDASPVAVVPPGEPHEPSPWTGRATKMRAKDYRGLIERRGPSGRRESDRCPHKHRTEDAAARCGRRFAAAANAGTVLLPLSSCATTVRRVLVDAGYGVGLEVRAHGDRALVTARGPVNVERMREYLDGAGWQAIVRDGRLVVGRRS